jgi:hypothetical protein
MVGWGIQTPKSYDLLFFSSQTEACDVSQLRTGAICFFSKHLGNDVIGFGALLSHTGPLPANTGQ